MIKYLTMEESVKKDQDAESIKPAENSEILSAEASLAVEDVKAYSEAVIATEEVKEEETLGIQHSDEADIRAALKEAIEVAVEEAASPEEKPEEKTGLEPGSDSQNSNIKPLVVIAELDKILHVEKEGVGKVENTLSGDSVTANAVEEIEANKSCEKNQNYAQTESLANEDSGYLEKDITETSCGLVQTDEASEKEIVSDEQKKESNEDTKGESANNEVSVPSKDIGQEECKGSEDGDDTKTNASEPKKRWITFDFLKSFALDVLFLIICAFFFFALATRWFASQQVTIMGTNQVQSSIESGEKSSIGNINILVMGVDSVEGTHRSDTIFVLGVNPSQSKVTMLSIPRDTRIIIEDKARKINEILPRYGEGMVRKIIEDLLKISISRKIEVGFESFIGLIDALGGVDINIEKAMDYDDNWGNLHIHFKPGMNHLDGKNALNYVRFRKDAMADLGRIKRQQEFVKVVIKKLMSPSSIIRLPAIIEKVFEYIDTDFTLPEILTLAKSFETFDIKLNTLSLPGEARYIDKISYFMPYSDEAATIGNSYFSNYALFELEKDFNLGKAIQKCTNPDRKK